MLLSWAFLLLSPLVTAYTVTVDSQHACNEGSKAGDGNVNTFWHSEYNPNKPFPHWAIIDLGSTRYINGANYFPRQDGVANGRIGNFKIETSTDNANWGQVATGSWLDDASMKQVGFTARNARYVRFTATSEAGNRGTWTSASEFNVNFAPTTAGGTGQWGPVIGLPIAPAAAFVEYNSGKVLTYASYRANDFANAPTGITYTATWDPANNAVSERIVTNTNHDMFCPGMSLLFSGRAFITGGDDSTKTSVYDPTTDSWSAAATMKIGRGYQSSTVLSNGKVFVIGGSWSGGRGGKNGEIFDPATGAWTLLSGCPVAPMLTNDAEGIFRQDNHGWLFAWKNSAVFQAGPSKAMNWYGTTGTGSRTSAGNRGNDVDSMNGNAVMYDAVAGKILTCGGATSYQDVDATNTAYIITIGNVGAQPQVQQVASMANRRAFANGVVLPNGKIFVTGGQTHAVPFTDATAIKTPELYDPATNTWTVLPAHVVSRNYHSIALLLPDARVWTGGGGLCGGCSTNHADSQIFSPSYLWNGNNLATRPVITAAPTQLTVGATFTITTNNACQSFSFIRYGSATHTVDTDQRRIVMNPTATNGNTYTFKLPTDAGIVLPGQWMFFATSGGVPSVAKTIKVVL